MKNKRNCQNVREEKIFTIYCVKEKNKLQDKVDISCIPVRLKYHQMTTQWLVISYLLPGKILAAKVKGKQNISTNKSAAARLIIKCVVSLRISALFRTVRKIATLPKMPAKKTKMYATLKRTKFGCRQIGSFHTYNQSLLIYLRAMVATSPYLRANGS